MKDTSENFDQPSWTPATRGSSVTGMSRKCGSDWLVAFLLFLGFAASGQAQQYYVDCSGANPSDYPTINSALANVTGPGASILVMGTCTETVNISNALNLSLGAWYGQTANLIGSITVDASESVFLYGLNVTNPTGNGFNFTSSRAVTLENCTSNQNQSLGLSATQLSEITVVGPASFDNNGTGGIQLNGNAVLSISNWQGSPTDISNNQGPGVWLSSGSLFGTIGLTTISNNSNPSSNTPPPGAYGIVVLGAGKAQIGTCFGPNTIQGNQSGGIYTQENAELSLYNCGLPYQSYILDNGPVGISAGLGSQVTLYQDVQISGHTGSGVELYGNSQLNVNGSNLISENGTAGNLRSAGIVVDGNSEAYLRGGQISFNHGPGILALVNSSADFTGATFSGNSGGVISCDSSAYMVSDLASGPGNLSAGIACTTPHNRGNHHGIFVAPAIQDTSVVKARHARYKKIASGKPH
jgi:hypothetical protein